MIKIYNKIFKKYSMLTPDEFMNLSWNKAAPRDEDKIHLIAYYENFLQTTDYIINKIIECRILNIEEKDYLEELKARQYAREQIQKLRI